MGILCIIIFPIIFRLLSDYYYTTVIFPEEILQWQKQAKEEQIIEQKNLPSIEQDEIYAMPTENISENMDLALPSISETIVNVKNQDPLYLLLKETPLPLEYPSMSPQK
jgi:hypothetical protein